MLAAAEDDPEDREHIEIVLVIVETEAPVVTNTRDGVTVSVTVTINPKETAAVTVIVEYGQVSDTAACLLSYASADVEPKTALSRTRNRRENMLTRAGLRRVKGLELGGESQGA